MCTRLYELGGSVRGVFRLEGNGNREEFRQRQKLPRETVSLRREVREIGRPEMWLGNEDRIHYHESGPLLAQQRRNNSPRLAGPPTDIRAKFTRFASRQ